MIDRRGFLAAGAALTAIGAAGRARSGPDWSALGRNIDGTVLRLGDAGYEAAVHALPLKQFDDIRPRAIVRCAGAGDVAECVRFARRFGVHVTARSGGHSFGGYSTTTGMVIDLGRMASVTGDGDAVRTGPGAQLVDVHATLDPSGRTIPTGWCPTVGMGGLTLGGGLGLETRVYGVTSDRLRSAEVVLANGRTVRCDAQRHRDLFWALRGGGGGNFGIVTGLEFADIPAHDITTYTMTWPWSQVREVLAAWQVWAPGTPDAMMPTLNLSQYETAPAAVTVSGAWLDTPGGLAEHLDRFTARAGHDPATHEVVTEPHLTAMMSWFGCADVDVEQCHQVGHNPRATLPRSAFALAHGNFYRNPIPRSAVEVMVAEFTRGWRTGQVRSLDLQALGGACNRVPATETAFVHRDSLFYGGFSVALPDSAPPDARRAAGDWLDAAWRTARPWSSGHVYQNYIDPSLRNWRYAYYGVNYPRLSATKRAYDPERFFDFKQAIR